MKTQRLWKMISLAVLVSLILTIPAQAAPPTTVTQPQQEGTTWLPVIGGGATGLPAVQQEVLREADGFTPVPPSDDLLKAIEEFQAGDPDADFSFFNGHVDNFATRPKNTIPGYALPILTNLGLNTTPQEPALLPDPTEEEKGSQNMDANLLVQFPWQPEQAFTQPSPGDDDDDNVGDDPGGDVKSEFEERVLPPQILEPRDDSWQQPSDRMVALLQQAALPILNSFVRQHNAVFEYLPGSAAPTADAAGSAPGMQPISFKSGRFYHMAKYQQYYGNYPVLGSEVAVLYDVNWNVVGISKMLVTTDKIEIDETVGINRDQALTIALEAAESLTGRPQEEWTMDELVLGADLMRRHLVYRVHLYIPAAPEFDVTVLIDARTGGVLTVSDNIESFEVNGADGTTLAIAYILPHSHANSTGAHRATFTHPLTENAARLREATQHTHPLALESPVADPFAQDITQDVEPASADAVAYTDARVRRWAYTNGDVRQPFQVTSTGVYVRDSNNLHHDFFMSANDQRTNGTLGACADQGNKTTWPSAAWGDFNSSTWIRPTVRNDRDFALWSPAEISGTFSESHNYFWSRQFFQWLKPALKELGVLPSNAANYPRVLMIVNACIDDIGYASGTGLAVSTQNNDGENLRKIRIADACRQGNPNCVAADYSAGKGGHYSSCDGLACMATPSIIHHEINHYVMAQFFGIGSGLDCNGSNQLRFLHEGTLGSVVPQAFWHRYYGVGYNPSDTDRLFTMNEVRGRVHVDNASLLTVGDWLCVNNTTTTAANKGPYNAGRVPAQALWKMYHGITVNGSSFGSTWRPATDTDFNILVYWAADLVASSTYMDRYEMANRVMEILDKHSNWSSSAKGQYCNIFQQHQLRSFINNSYCS